MKHIKENCNTCGVKLTDTNWSLSWRSVNRTQCIKCSKNNNTKSNPNRMYVNGKHVSVKHPLYKAGRFKTFEGAAFAALEGYEKTTEGYVYIINNPCWDGWLKIGMAVDAEDRCNSYQTSSPHRDYRLLYARRFKDRRKAEKKTIHKLKKVVKEHNGEWFKTDRNTAQEIIGGLSITL